MLHFVKPENHGRKQEQLPCLPCTQGRVALAWAAAITDSFIHFPAIQRLILAWQTLPLITDFAPTTTIPPCKKAQAIHQSEECVCVSFALFLSLHEVPSGSISFKINFSTFLKKCCIEIKCKAASSSEGVLVLLPVGCESKNPTFL